MESMVKDISECMLGTPCYFLSENNSSGLLVLANPYQQRKRVYCREDVTKYTYEPISEPVVENCGVSTLYKEEEFQPRKDILPHAFCQNAFVYTPYDIGQSFSNAAFNISSKYTWKELHASLDRERTTVCKAISGAAFLHGYKHKNQLEEILSTVYEYPCESGRRCYARYMGGSVYCLLPPIFYRINTIIKTAASLEMFIQCCLFRIARYMTRKESPAYSFLLDKQAATFSIDVNPKFECMCCQIAKRSLHAGSNLFTLPILTKSYSQPSGPLHGTFPPPEQLSIKTPRAFKQKNTNFRVLDSNVITANYDDYTLCHILSTHELTSRGEFLCIKKDEIEECKLLQGYW